MPGRSQVYGFLVRHVQLRKNSLNQCKSTWETLLELPLFRYFIDYAVPVEYEEFAISIITEVDGLKRPFRDLGGDAGFFRFANWSSYMGPIELLHVYNLSLGIFQ